MNVWKYNNARIIGALIGLVGAINNNGKLVDTDQVVREALLSEDSEEILGRIREEKYAISPGCATCETPCGNTSDYDTTRFANLDAETLQLKMRVVEALREVAGRREGELPDVVYQALSYLGYDLQPVSYIDLLQEMNP